MALPKSFKNAWLQHIETGHHMIKPGAASHPLKTFDDAWATYNFLKDGAHSADHRAGQALLAGNKEESMKNFCYGFQSRNACDFLWSRLPHGTNKKDPDGSKHRHFVSQTKAFMEAAQGKTIKYKDWQKLTQL